MIMDAGMAIARARLTALAAWGPAGLPGGSITGPSWLLALLPLLMGAPLVMWMAIWAAIAPQYLITRHPSRGLELFVLFIDSYSLGAHTSLPRSAADLAISAVIILSARQGFDLNAVSCEPP